MPNKNNKKSNRSKKDRKTPAIVPFFRPGPVVQHVNMAFRDVRYFAEAAAGAGAVYVYRLNSIYDPDLTGVGGTALGYTAYSNFYTRYKVLRVKIHLRGIPRADGPVSVGFMVGPNSTTTATASAWPVEPNSFGELLTGATVNSGGPNSVYNRTMSVDIPKILGITRKEFVDTDYSSLFGSNPAKMAYMIIYLQGLGGIVASGTFDVRLFFDVELSQPYQAVTN